MKNCTVTPLENLRTCMKKHCIDMAVIVTSDDHQSEYVHDHFKFREYISGFTGSAGILVVTPDEAGLWTDGRYFLQAEEQLSGSGITLFKSGEPGVLTWPRFVEKNLPEKGRLYVDGKTISTSQGLSLSEICKKKNADFVCDKDLASDVWPERPALVFNPVYSLPDHVCGETVFEKLGRLRSWMSRQGVQSHVICSLDDIAWLFNLRGSDIAFSPLFLSYAIVENDRAFLYADLSRTEPSVVKYLNENEVHILPYRQIYEDISSLPSRVSIDPDKVNYTLYLKLAENSDRYILKAAEPVMLMKCVKNEAELTGIRLAHEKDGAAFVKFLYWLSKNRSSHMTEISLSDRLELFRMQQEGYMYPSFAPISGFKEHGAVVHYSATEHTDKCVEGDGLLLLDTGSHFDTGSTDITRTIGFGTPSFEEKFHYTTVLRAMLHLAFAKFHSKTEFTALDFAARSILYAEGLNYNHGTGHGIGFIGTIHEPPIGFRMISSNMPPITPNMIITDEPGVYISGSHGIRIENELLVQKWKENEFGTFYCFEILTLVPIDKSCLMLDLMSEEEKNWLNTYHKIVYDRVRSYLNKEEREWLADACAPV